MPHARRPEKRLAIPEGVLDVSAARELARAIHQSGGPARWVVDCHRVRVLPDATLALLAELARSGVKLLGLDEHHRRVLHYLLMEDPTSTPA
jgi:hypothetical protein